MTIDLNCDMGEGFGPWPMGDDEAMLDIVSSANIACGFHAGDPSIMFRTAEIAKRKGVAIGAHPGFNDLHGFGRRAIRGDSPAEIERMIAYQIGAMQALATLAGHKVTYVKVHGALNNMANEDESLALAIARAIKGVDAGLVNVCMPGLLMEKASGTLGLRVAREIFSISSPGMHTLTRPASTRLMARAMASARLSMIAAAGTVKLQAGISDGLDLDADVSLRLQNVGLEEDARARGHVHYRL